MSKKQSLAPTIQPPEVGQCHNADLKKRNNHFNYFTGHSTKIRFNISGTWFTNERSYPHFTHMPGMVLSGDKFCNSGTR